MVPYLSEYAPRGVAYLMSQKINPFHLRSQRTARIESMILKKRGTPNGGLSLKEVPHWSEICYSEPKKRKWGSNYYSRTLHENQLISDYCQGFFRTFGCYQKLCTVERSQQSTYQTIHVTSHVLRTPVSRIYDDAFEGCVNLKEINCPKNLKFKVGVFTGIAMLLAMISVLTLLPKLILTFKPFGEEIEKIVWLQVFLKIF